MKNFSRTVLRGCPETSGVKLNRKDKNRPQLSETVSAFLLKEKTTKY